MPPFLCKKFRNNSSHGLVCTQFLAAFNIYIGEDPKSSKDAITEFFHYLSMQGLSKSDDSVFLKFESFTELVKDNNNLLNQNIFNLKLEEK